jgi:hypothetical protein
MKHRVQATEAKTRFDKAITGVRVISSSLVGLVTGRAKPVVKPAVEQRNAEMHLSLPPLLPAEGLSEATLRERVIDRWDGAFSSERDTIEYVKAFMIRFQNNQVTEEEVAYFLGPRYWRRPPIRPWLLPCKTLANLEWRGYVDGCDELDMSGYGGYLVSYDACNDVKFTLSARDQANFDYLYAFLDEFFMATDDATSDAAQQFSNLIMLVRNQAWQLSFNFTRDADLPLFLRFGLERLWQVLHFGVFNSAVVGARELEFRVHEWLSLVLTEPVSAVKIRSLT